MWVIWENAQHLQEMEMGESGNNWLPLKAVLCLQSTYNTNEARADRHKMEETKDFHKDLSVFLLFRCNRKFRCNVHNSERVSGLF